MAEKEKTIDEQLAEGRARFAKAKQGLHASYEKVDKLAEEGRRETITPRNRQEAPAYIPPASKEKLSVSELLALQRAEAGRALRQAGGNAGAQKVVRTEAKPPPGIPGLDKQFAATAALLKRSRELRESQERLVQEMAANPLEEQCDAVYADIGRQLYGLEEEEMAAASEADAFLEATERNDEAEDALERSGQPPPLRVIK